MASETPNPPAAVALGAATSAAAGKDTPGKPAEDDAALESVFGMPGHLLRRCHQISVAIFLDACAAHDLTPLQFVTLVALARGGPLEQVTLGGVTALDRTTTAVVVKKLEERGLASKQPSPSDRRSKLVAVTAAGRALLDAVLPTVEAAQFRILAPLNARERVLFLRLLDKIARGNNELSRAPCRVRRKPPA